ncbi:hypothetical protein B9Z65_7510 [Elsinoe australis]|uniref:Uncharacterized protein n=1 Tax=Elsinoe australis TaxID=40998 RepID=A0A2P7YCD5_9PEZI|nr:hypothetical protein B9Z65_7510 [Elsinoe australis]
MRFLAPLALLAVSTSALPITDSDLTDSSTGLEKRAEGMYPFTFSTALRGAVRQVSGVALSITYNAVNGWLFHVHNKLAQDIVAYVVDVSSGNTDVSAQPIDAGKEYSWYVGHNLVDTNDQGKFEWKTNY